MFLNHATSVYLFNLIFIISQRDYSNISRVCVKWYRIIAGLRILNESTFNDCFQNGEIKWRCFDDTTVINNHDQPPAKRHSHCCARIKDKLFVFGGLSATSTSYNDIWIFNLNTKTWSRPINTSGQYPSPKAAATLLPYSDETLILYGGYSHPYSYPFNQQVNFYDELHIYCTRNNIWTHKLFSHDTPKLAGHTASVIDKNKMILFGGCNGSLGNKANTVYCLNLDTYEWVLHNSSTDSHSLVCGVKVDGPKPEARYGHSQITLDDHRILIIGGCGGPNKQYDDIWILNWSNTAACFWQQVIINNLINSPTQLYCVSFVKCDNKLVTFGKPRTTLNPSISHSTPLCILGASNARGSLKVVQQRKCTCSSSIQIIDKPLPVQKNTNDSPNDNNNNIEMSLLNKSQRNTIKRLEALKKIASKLNNTLKDERDLKVIQQQLNSTQSLTRTQNNCILHSKFMQTFVLDISNLLNPESTRDNLVASWQIPIFCLNKQSPTDTILYTLTKGLDEIILFGGMELDSPLIHLKPSYDYIKVSNKLFIMKPNSLCIASSSSTPDSNNNHSNVAKQSSK